VKVVSRRELIIKVSNSMVLDFQMIGNCQFRVERDPGKRSKVSCFLVSFFHDVPGTSARLTNCDALRQECDFPGMDFCCKAFRGER